MLLFALFPHFGEQRVEAASSSQELSLGPAHRHGQSGAGADRGPPHSISVLMGTSASSLGVEASEGGDVTTVHCHGF